MNYNGKLNPKDIWNIKQNKPRYIARDMLKHGIPKEETYKILLGRGVFKWLAVRRDLIKLKNVWRDRLSELYQKAQENKGSKEHREIVGRIKAMEECRAEVRELCHSDRWRAPDFDREAVRFLEELNMKSQRK